MMVTIQNTIDHLLSEKLSQLEIESSLKQISEFLISKTENIEILVKIIQLLEVKNSVISQSVESSLLQYFDTIRKEDYTKIGDLLNFLKAKFEQGKAREFLENCIKANEYILNEAYKEIIRGATSAYLYDGTKAICPECHSDKVHMGENSLYEFTEMICDNCGNHEMADNYQLSNWYP